MPFFDIEMLLCIVTQKYSNTGTFRVNYSGGESEKGLSVHTYNLFSAERKDGGERMAGLSVKDLTFSYDNSFDTIFEHVNFHVDTSWKLGLMGRNGKGKTTLLNLLMGKYDYTGKIISNTKFDYFPYEVSDDDLQMPAAGLAEKWKPDVEFWQIVIQLHQIQMDPECMFRPFGTLSQGERTRVMLAVLFAGENEFLLIDEPTNHLDQDAREMVRDFLAKKKGFILVSHDRGLLDAVIDHVLVLNRKTVEIQAGNFTSWWENKERSDAFALAENEKHLTEIRKLKTAADRSKRWAKKNESTKIGFDPLKEPERNISTRSYIGAKTKKMQSRVKSYERRIDREIEAKEGLLQDIEHVPDLKIQPLSYHKELLVNVNALSIGYGEEEPLFQNVRFQIKNGSRIFLAGMNGCGKSSIIKAILKEAGMLKEESGQIRRRVEGELSVASGLTISYVNQDTSFLSGTLQKFCEERNLSESLLLTILRQLDFNREQFAKDMSDFSEGQKKKVLIAASLLTPAHLYIWDEPLNYIDVFSRMQIEKLILKFQPAMLLVEHDSRFQEKTATGIVRIV